MNEHYIFAGQSNATPCPNGSQTGMQGPFCTRMNTLRPTHTALTIDAAVGGSKMGAWKRDWRTTSHYGAMLAAARSVMAAGGVIKALVWWQGESDAGCSSESPYPAWPENLSWTSDFTRLISDIRVDLGIAALPVAFAQLGPEPNGIWAYAGWGGFCLRQSQISAPNVVMVTTNDQSPLATNDVHLTTSGYAVVGVRMADALNSLI